MSTRGDGYCCCCCCCGATPAPAAAAAPPTLPPDKLLFIPPAAAAAAAIAAGGCPAAAAAAAAACAAAVCAFGMRLMVNRGLKVLVAPIARNRAGSNPAATSSFVRQSASSAKSWRYRHSGLLQGTPLRKALQYFVVPKHALTGFPRHNAPSMHLIHLKASSMRLNVT